MGNVKFLFFDIGCTLVDESAVWAARCAEQAAGAEARALGLTAGDIYRAIEEASAAHLPQYRTVVERYGFREAAPYRAELEVLYSQTKTVLAALAGRYRLGVLANQGDGLRQRLCAYGIAQYFDVVVSSWDYPFVKPDVRLFAAAVELAGVRPFEAVMIGDRLDNDIAPAKRLGMHTVWVKQGFGALQLPRCAEEVPDFAVATIGDVPALFGVE